MKAAIILCSHDTALYLQVGKIRLPQGVRFAAMRECFDRAGIYEVRVEGEGIPDTLIGDLLPHVDLVELPDGTVDLIGPWKYAAPVPAGSVVLTEGHVSKGGQNIPDGTEVRPQPPQGSGGCNA